MISRPWLCLAILLASGAKSVTSMEAPDFSGLAKSLASKASGSSSISRSNSDVKPVTMRPPHVEHLKKGEIEELEEGEIAPVTMRSPHVEHSKKGGIAQPPVPKPSSHNIDLHISDSAKGEAKALQRRQKGKDLSPSLKAKEQAKERQRIDEGRWREREHASASLSRQLSYPRASTLSRHRGRLGTWPSFPPNKKRKPDAMIADHRDTRLLQNPQVSSAHARLTTDPIKPSGSSAARPLNKRPEQQVGEPSLLRKPSVKPGGPSHEATASTPYRPQGRRGRSEATLEDLPPRPSRYRRLADHTGRSDLTSRGQALKTLREQRESRKRRWREMESLRRTEREAGLQVDPQPERGSKLPTQWLRRNYPSINLDNPRVQTPPVQHALSDKPGSSPLRSESSGEWTPPETASVSSSPPRLKHQAGGTSTERNRTPPGSPEHASDTHSDSDSSRHLDGERKGSSPTRSPAQTPPQSPYRSPTRTPEHLSADSLPPSPSRPPVKDLERSREPSPFGQGSSTPPGHGSPAPSELAASAGTPHPSPSPPSRGSPPLSPVHSDSTQHTPVQSSSDSPAASHHLSHGDMATQSLSRSSTHSGASDQGEEYTSPKREMFDLNASPKRSPSSSASPSPANQPSPRGTGIDLNEEWKPSASSPRQREADRQGNGFDLNASPSSQHSSK